MKEIESGCGEQQEVVDRLRVAIHRDYDATMLSGKCCWGEEGAECHSLMGVTPYANGTAVSPGVLQLLFRLCQRILRNGIQFAGKAEGG